MGTGSIAQRLPFQRSPSALPALPLVTDCPTAMQDVAELHDTAENELNFAPLGFGVASSPQLLPFQRSASVTLALPPTAVHAPAEVQEVPKRSLESVARGLGVDWIAHVLPFQRSAKVAGRAPLEFSDPPTARHAFAELHNTLLRAPSGRPVGFEIDWTDQPLPFHRSASGACLPPAKAYPPAMHEFAEPHPTARSKTPLTEGVAWTDQLLPFQRSANAAPLKLLLVWSPTAVHALAELHETAFSSLKMAPVGTGVAWSAQPVPFHRSASGTPWLLLFSVVPAAVHALAEVHETLRSLLSGELPRLGVAWIAQLVPFQRSASGNSSKLLVVVYPTATHELADAHETPSRIADLTPLTLGVASTVHWLPLQRAAIVELPATPTAMHELAEVHETDCRELAFGAGLGVDAIVQRAPFQRSESVD